jgi:hypothetical protein
MNPRPTARARGISIGRPCHFRDDVRPAAFPSSAIACVAQGSAVSLLIIQPFCQLVSQPYLSQPYLGESLQSNPFERGGISLWNRKAR